MQKILYLELGIRNWFDEILIYNRGFLKVLIKA